MASGAKVSSGSLRKKKELEMEFNHQWPKISSIIPKDVLWNILRNPKRWGLENLLVDEQVDIWGEWYVPRGHGSTTPFPLTFPYASLLSGWP